MLPFIRLKQSKANKFITGAPAVFAIWLFQSMIQSVLIVSICRDKLAIQRQRSNKKKHQLQNEKQQQQNNH